MAARLSISYLIESEHQASSLPNMRSQTQSTYVRAHAEAQTPGPLVNMMDPIQHPPNPVAVDKRPLQTTSGPPQIPTNSGLPPFREPFVSGPTYPLAAVPKPRCLQPSGDPFDGAPLGIKKQHRNTDEQQAQRIIEHAFQASLKDHHRVTKDGRKVSPQDGDANMSKPSDHQWPPSENTKTGTHIEMPRPTRVHPRSAFFDVAGFPDDRVPMPSANAVMAHDIHYAVAEPQHVFVRCTPHKIQRITNVALQPPKNGDIAKRRLRAQRARKRAAQRRSQAQKQSPKAPGRPTNGRSSRPKACTGREPTATATAIASPGTSSKQDCLRRSSAPEPECHSAREGVQSCGPRRESCPTAAHPHGKDDKALRTSGRPERSYPRGIFDFLRFELAPSPEYVANEFR